MYSETQINASITKRNHLIIPYLKYIWNKCKMEILHFKRLRELQKIIKNQSLNTFYQPIVDLQTGKTIAFEALNRPMESRLFPNTENFYDFVGQSNQVFTFELFTRNLSLQRFMDQLKSTTDYDCPPLLFINIHPNVLLDVEYHSGETLQLLSELGIKPSQVVFELTEKSAVSDYTLFEKVLSNYRAQGYRIAIDDMGSGYNSLKTLIYLKPEFIKLDKTLTQNIDCNLEQQQLVKLIINYAKQFSTKIIAEGIERNEDLAFCQKEGVAFGQGFALGKPHQKIKLGKIPLVV